jgi:hypothetical protein
VSPEVTGQEHKVMDIHSNSLSFAQYTGHFNSDTKGLICITLFFTNIIVSYAFHMTLVLHLTHKRERDRKILLKLHTF